MYVTPNFKTKKALKEALASGVRVDVYSPGLGEVPVNGRVFLEGPHAPAPHTWYAEGRMENGRLIKIK